MAYTDEVLADTPLAYYRLGDAAGATVAVDSSGNGRDGGVFGTVTFETPGALAGSGDDDTALSIDVSPSKVDLAYAAWMNGLAAVTMEVWARFTSTGALSHIFSRRTTSNQYGIFVQNGRAGFTVRTASGSASPTDPGDTLADDEWHHLVGTWDGTVVRIYVDGAEKASAPLTGSSIASGSNGLQIGGRQANYYTGKVDEAALYATALSAARVEAHYAASGAAVSNKVILTGVLPNPTGTFEASFAATATLTGELPKPTAVLDIVAGVHVTLDARLPRMTSTFALDTAVPPEPPATTRRAPGDGRRRGGHGIARWDPPVVPAPATIAPAHAYVIAQSYESVTINGTRPRLTGYATTQRRRQPDRIVVAGRDITYWRGVATPLPVFGLVEPLLYGSGSLTLPQIAAPFETPGIGHLNWLRPGAQVLVQRVNVDTGKVVTTDYRGFISAIDTSGRNIRLDLGGEAIGRANLIDKQPPIFRRRNDLGWWWWRTMTAINRPFEPAGGPDTGIQLHDSGGVSLGDYAQQLSASGVSAGGAQWTCMPNAAGVYKVARKDLTTIDGTVYLDDARTVARLRRDVAEEPNRIYGTGVTARGERVKFGVYPVLADHPPVPYPNLDERPIGPGDTNADTDTGGGVTALIKRLTQTGYLTVLDSLHGYDSDVADAVRDLQADAALPETGTVDVLTWAMLYDVDATGYSTADSYIAPIVQRDRVKRVRRNAAGLVIGPNLGYNPRALVVDRTLDFGTGVSRARMRAWARGEIAPNGDGNWVGTIVFNSGALVAGEHTPGDPVTSADVMPARSLKPGMNLWLPLFAEGTLLHVSGVDVAADGTVTAAVDTQARDTMKVWEVIARNRENRRNPARSWIRDYRSSSFVKDAVVEFDEVGGTITDTPLGEGWNVVPVVAGQEGTIARLRLTMETPAEFVVAVFGRRVGRRGLAAKVPNPLSTSAKARWANEGVRRQLDQDFMLYVAGDSNQPCGYFPGTKPTEDDEVGLLTGRWEDDAGFGYRTFDQSCVLWLAIYAKAPTTLLGGRVMWNQLEAGS